MRLMYPSIIGFLLALPVIAHHSGAMFDDKKAITIAGTVRAFQWTNPHCWIQVLAPGPDSPLEWNIEMGSPSMLMRGGWRPASLRAGDKIKVVVHPMRDGTNSGLFMSATRDDGQPIVATIENSPN